MYVHGIVLSFRDQVWLLAAAGVICLSACYAAASLATNLMEFAPASSRGSLLTASVALGLGISLTQYAALLGLLPARAVSFAVLPTILSLAVAVLGSAAGLWVTIKRRKWTGTGGAMIGLTAAATNYFSLAAINVSPNAHRHLSLVMFAMLSGMLFCSTATSVLRPSSSVRARLAIATLLTLGVLDLHIVSDIALSLQHAAAGSAHGDVIAERWIAIGVVPTALIILVLAFFSNLTGRYLGELASTQHRLQDATRNLKIALDQAEQANDARARFMAHMSHELRTPLNAIIGFSDLMKQQSFGPLSERYCEYSAIIYDSGSHLLDLINQVLDIAKIDAGRVTLREEMVDVFEVIRGCARLLAGQVERSKVTLTVESPENLPWLYADARIFRQIVLNLLSNALKFTPEGGTVRISAAPAAAGLCVVVSDTGIGIDAKSLPSVFERFGQVDNAYTRTHRGTGLGLPLVKDFAEAHQGSVTLDSTPGQGTCVRVLFPAERLRAAPCAVAPSTAAELSVA